MAEIKSRLSVKGTAEANLEKDAEAEYNLKKMEYDHELANYQGKLIQYNADVSE